jgi:hypothetical protein
VTESDPISITIKLHLLARALPRFDHMFQTTDIPRNGIYIMFETGELIGHPEFEGDRIVRIGTHRVDDRLPRRLRQHYRWNKRASVLRRHVSSAMSMPDGLLPKDAEALLSGAIADRFSFACIAVPEKSERMHLERSLIAQLARHPIGSPSPDWSGLRSASPGVRSSGLWNVMSLRGVGLTLAELDRLIELIQLAEEQATGSASFGSPMTDGYT